MIELANPSPAVESYPGAQSVSRAIALLKAFDDAHPAWNLGDLSEHLGLHKTTTHRLLAALESEGLILRDGGGQYRLGVELIALGSSAMRGNDLRAAARPILEALAQETGESATLELLVKQHVLILDEASGRFPGGTTESVGMRLPLHATSTGKVLLAHLDEAALGAFLARPLAALTPHTITDPEQLCAQLAQVRKQGWAIAEGEMDIGFTAVAAPVYDAARQVAAAASVGGPSLRLSGERLPAVIASLQVAARQISRHLGYRPGGGR